MGSSFSIPFVKEPIRGRGPMWISEMVNEAIKFELELRREGSHLGC